MCIELHYYSPEFRQTIKQAIQQNKPECLQFSNKNGQAQDMYSFGVILFEILYLKKIVEIEDVLIDSNKIKTNHNNNFIFNKFLF